MESQFGIANLWAQGDIVTRFVALLLLAMSLASWMVIIIKTLDLLRYKKLAQKAFREKWGKKEAGELYGYLKRLDPVRAKTIDRQNKVRLLRAIEIAKALGSVPVIDRSVLPDLSGYIVIGINPPVEELNKKIRERFMTRMKAGMLDEAIKLNRAGLSYERMESFGLEYRALVQFLQKKITDAELYTNLPYEIIHYAKRQRSSLRRLEKQGMKIHWIKDISEAGGLVK